VTLVGARPAMNEMVVGDTASGPGVGVAPTGDDALACGLGELGDGDVLANGDGLLLADGDALPLPDGDALPLPDGDALPLADGDALPLADGDALPLADGDALPLADGDALPLADGPGELVGGAADGLAGGAGVAAGSRSRGPNNPSPPRQPVSRTNNAATEPRLRAARLEETRFKSNSRTNRAPTRAFSGARISRHD